MGDACHIIPGPISLHWLPDTFHPHFKILTLPYKSLKRIGSHYINALISRYEPTKSLKSQTKYLLCVPSSRTVSYGSKILSVAAAQLWNDLPESLRILCFSNICSKRIFPSLYSRSNVLLLQPFFSLD